MNVNIIYANEVHMKSFDGNNFTNAKFGDNVNIQGDHVSQVKTTQTGASEQILQELLKTIQSLPESDEKKDALDNFDKLGEAVTSKNLERAKRIFGWLPEIIKTTAAGITVARALGLLP